MSSSHNSRQQPPQSSRANSTASSRFVPFPQAKFHENRLHSQPLQPPPSSSYKRHRHEHDPAVEEPSLTLEQKLRAENKFLLQQAIARADIRIAEARPKLIDLVVASLFSTAFVIEPLDLVSLAKKLKSALAKEEFFKDVRHMSEINEDLEEFWNVLYELNAEADAENQVEKDAAKSKMEITEKARKLLAGKTLADVRLLKASIAAKLAQKDVPIDYDYWGVMLNIVTAQYKRLRIEELHSKHSVPISQKADFKVFAPNERIFAKMDSTATRSSSKSQAQASNAAAAAATKQNAAPIAVTEDSLIDSIAADVKRYTFFDSSHQAKRMYHEEANKRLHDDEQIFEMEVELATQSHAEYTVPAIKPRYFAKVRAVYEWNKYNQTHYDIDNPPPKTIVGYQFRVFYPLLKDSTKAPHYRIESSAIDEGRHSCILRFVASEPYADLGFRIISDDWDLSAKHGFRCYFEDCVLYLRFNLRKSHHRSK